MAISTNCCPVVMSMQFVDLGVGAFSICWLCVFATHAATGAFYVIVAKIYWQLESTYLATFLEYFSIGISAQHYRTIAVIHAACAAPHGLAVLSMLSGSLTSRSLIFHSSRHQLRRRRQFISAPLSRHARISAWFSNWRSAALEMPCLGYIVQKFRLRDKYDLIFGRTGYFGVGGQYYGLILFVREMVETAIQTSQAYRMSLLLPRATVNHLYSCLIVFNCWLTVILHVMIARSSSRRLVILLSDCALDLVASAGITLAIVSHYIPISKWTFEGFASALWADDGNWQSQVRNEMKLVFVMSWSDMISRVVFAAGVALSLVDIKALVRHRSKRNQVHQSPTHDKSSGPTQEMAMTTVMPAEGGRQPKPSRNQQTSSEQRVNEAIPMSRWKRVLVIAAHAVFVLWGFAVLVLHLRAASLPNVDQCRLQVRPWGVSVPSCYLVEFDCLRFHVTGSLEQVSSMWAQFGHETVERIMIRHCSELEMPSQLQQFRRLNTFKVYNSTIVSWNSDAAITATHHPHIEYIQLVRVSLPNGDVPAGLLSLDIPATLKEITFCVSNLQRLPDDLDIRWPKNITINLELSELASVSDTLVRLQPSTLSLYGNPIGDVPSALFEIEGLAVIDVGESNIEALPEHVDALSSTLSYIFLPNTLVSVFWDWIDPMIERTNPDQFWVVTASGTPYCAMVEGIQDMSRSGFDLADGDASYSLLMDADGHWDQISALVMCDPYFEQPYFPLAYEDYVAAEASTAIAE